MNKLLELNTKSGNKVFINPDHITSILVTDTGVHVNTVDGRSFDVSESMYAITKNLYTS